MPSCNCLGLSLTGLHPDDLADVAAFAARRRSTPSVTLRFGMIRGVTALSGGQLHRQRVAMCCGSAVLSKPYGKSRQ